MRILITGGAGFIGSHLCQRLLEQGKEVICVDNLISGNRDNIAHLIKNPQFEFIQSDISKLIEIKGSLDAILHFASLASPIDYQKYPIQTLKVGSLGTLNALGLAKAKGAKFMLASTSEVYGDPLVHPQKEDYWGNVNAVGPRGMYDESKRFAEALVMAYHRYHKIDTRIVRIFNTFGERMRENDGRAIPAFINQTLNNKEITVFGDGSQTRSFCYISDMVKGICKLLASDLHNPVNIGNPREMSILDLAKLILKLTNSNSKLVFKALPVDDPKVRQPDITLARQKLNWSPKVLLEEGLKKTIEFFKVSD
ncbi:MAG: SDR family oxidoreductase [Candidatus Omnitrophica bacterium]|nr:SDR family oxidoreductase [Candidatus Omnitrophota bacterium]